jgi:chitodextrinase
VPEGFHFMPRIKPLELSGCWRNVLATLVASIALLGCPAPPETESSDPGTGGGSTGGGSTTTPDSISPSTPTALAATSVSPSQVRLGWSASTDNVAVTGYRVYRNGVLLATPGNVTTYQDASVSASTGYSYTVQAMDAAGNASGQSTALILTTPAAPDTTAPTAPTGLTASVVSASRIDLSWTAATDNVAVTGYRIFQNGAPLVTLGNVTTFQDTSVFAAATFVYTVRALDAAGNASALSAAASATTPTGPDTVAPTTPTGLNASAVSPTLVGLSWSASTDNVAVAGYRVYRDGVMLAILANVTVYQDNNSVTATTTYSYNVDAVDAAGNVSGLSTATTVTTPALPDTTAPSTPAGVTANAVSASRINLSWITSTDNVGVTGYRVFRNGSLLVTLGNVTTYANTGLAASTTYNYAIRALDAAGNVSSLSATASATTQAAADTVAPSIPAGLTANAVSTSQINLGWSASTDNVAVTGYRVYRNGVFLVALGNVTTFQNTGLSESTTYSYNVDAVDAAGNASGVSAAASATTQASGGTPGTPAISGVSGTIAHGQAITVAGSSFGSKSHAGPMLWDDFDSGANGGVVAGSSGGIAPLIHQGNLATYSEWIRDGGGNYGSQSIIFNNSSPKANSSLHARATFSNDNYWGLNLLVPYSNFTTGNELYVSFYYRMTRTGSAFPRQSKAWIAYNSNWEDRAYFSTAYNNCESGPFRTHRTQNTDETYLNLAGANTSGEWVRFESYLKQSSAGGANGAWRQTAYRPTLGTPTKEVINKTNYLMRTTSDNWTQWTFGGAYWSMCGSSDTGTIDVDDFYMDSTQARIEVCNAATYSASTRCELQLPTAWSDTAITATFKKGHLPSATTAYVYVINQAGSVNAAGFPVSVGP